MTRVKSHPNSFLHMFCTYVCASVCPALTLPSFSRPPSSSIYFSFSLSFSFSVYPPSPRPWSLSQSLKIYLSAYQSNPLTPVLSILSLSLFLMSVRVELAWMCESMFKPRAFRSSCRLKGWEGNTITGQFFSPRRVRSIGRDRRILVIRRRDVSKFFVKAESFPQTLLYFQPSPLEILWYFFLCLRLHLSPSFPTRDLLLFLIFTFNRIILTRLCFIRAARSVCSGITSTQGKKTRRR